MGFLSWIKHIFHHATPPEVATPIQPTAPVLPAPSLPSQPTTNYPVLSWERGNLGRRMWTIYICEMLDQLLPSFDCACDRDKFRSNYAILERAKRIHLWAEMISRLTYYECDWNPNEADVDTGTAGNLNSYSVGPLQLSVDDQFTEQWGRFNYGYTFEDLKDPFKNFNLGLHIMAHLIDVKGMILIPHHQGEYWSTLAPGHPENHVDAILRWTNSMQLQGGWK